MFHDGSNNSCKMLCEWILISPCKFVIFLHLVNIFFNDVFEQSQAYLRSPWLGPLGIFQYEKHKQEANSNLSRLKSIP